MATYYTSLYKAQGNLSATGTANQASASVNYPQSRDAGGKLREMIVPYAVANTEANTESIYLCTLPLKAKVVAGKCRIIRQATGTLFVVSVGDSTDTVRYCNQANVTAAGDTAFSGGGGVATDQYVPSTIDYANQRDLICTVHGVPNTLTAAAKMLFLITYVDPAG
jgi:hypothetical protein